MPPRPAADTADTVDMADITGMAGAAMARGFTGVGAAEDCMADGAEVVAATSALVMGDGVMATGASAMVIAPAFIAVIGPTGCGAICTAAMFTPTRPSWAPTTWTTMELTIRSLSGAC